MNDEESKDVEELIQQIRTLRDVRGSLRRHVTPGLDQEISHQRERLGVILVTQALRRADEAELAQLIVDQGGCDGSLGRSPQKEAQA